MPEQVDERVSLSFHPETFTALDGYNEDSAKFIGDAVSAFNDAYRTIAKVHDATEAGKRNGAWTDEQRILAVSKVAGKEQERLLRKLDAALANTTKAAEHIERELSLPVESKASLGIAAEIRAHAKSLGKGQMDFVRGLIEAGDDLSVSAVLGGPSYLSGLTDDMRTVLTRMWHERQNPALVQRLTLLRATAEKIERDGPLVFREMEKAVGAKATRVQSIDRANEAALAALKIEPTV